MSKREFYLSIQSVKLNWADAKKFRCNMRKQPLLPRDRYMIYKDNNSYRVVRKTFASEISLFGFKNIRGILETWKRQTAKVKKWRRIGKEKP